MLLEVLDSALLGLGAVSLFIGIMRGRARQLPRAARTAFFATAVALAMLYVVGSALGRTTLPEVRAFSKGLFAGVAAAFALISAGGAAKPEMRSGE
jgi:hypothetical protein